MDSKDIELLYKEAKARGEIITLVAELEKENKELKEHKENLIRADKKKTEHIEELEKENKELKETLEHRDSVLSIMYDLVRCDYIKPKLKLDIIKAVIDDECGNFDDLTEKEKELWNYFWKCGFR